MNKILLSIDMDEWYHCRWATGSEKSIWDNLEKCWQDYYGANSPPGEIISDTKKVISLLKKLDIRATFFFTGHLAKMFPDLVKFVSENGYEIGSHNYLHQDYDLRNSNIFEKHLVTSKKILETLSGQDVIGYRAPNSVVSNFQIHILIKHGFLYDSSITPTFPIFGKFGNFFRYPTFPFRLSNKGFEPGQSKLVEFPWPVFPFFRLPSGSGFTTRMFGYYYTDLTLGNALKKGHTVYYFHPYEIGNGIHLASYGSFFNNFKMRNIGDNYYKVLKRILKKYKKYFTSGKLLIKEL